MDCCPPISPHDEYDEWLKVEGQDQVDRSIFSAERARGMMHWLEQMHAAGIYRDEVAYPHLKQMAVEFDLPLELGAKLDGPAPRVFASWNVTPPATPRPMIKDFQAIAAKPGTNQIVQWDEPISPAENTAILARFAQYPGVNVYWMGRSYLGQNLWAADLTLPSPALLRSWPKESTTKAVIVYSGRQHANEVSSTSHIDKLAEQLLTDPDKREALKKVNVVLHPITNPDGSQLSVDLAKITPDNMLHPGYHGTLSADVSTGQTETDPIYPESRTRKQLIDAWLPDAFLNPHGYPSHEWVQPFSEYSGWVQSRQGANSGRAWWIPRGWFTSMGYLRDEQHPYSKEVAYAIQDKIVEAERKVPGLLPLEDRMNARYERFGQRWQPKDMFQPIVNGIRIYMGLKGTAGGGGRGGAAAARRGGTAGGGSARKRRRGRAFRRCHVGRGLHGSAGRDRARRLHEADGIGGAGVRLRASELSGEGRFARHANRARRDGRRAVARGARASDSAGGDEAAGGRGDGRAVEPGGLAVVKQQIVTPVLARFPAIRISAG